MPHAARQPRSWLIFDVGRDSTPHSRVNSMNPRDIFTIVSAILTVTSSLVAQDRHIGTINFYGYPGLDLQQLRATLPFHEGDPFPSREQLAAAREPFANAIGRTRVRFSPNCCLADGRLLLFVGIEEPEAAPIIFNPKPAGDARLPVELVKLYLDHEQEVRNAVRQGKGQEDDSQGFRLMVFPPARALELKIRDYAQAHPAHIIKVLAESKDDEHRVAAAVAIGYADESDAQIAALVRASFDPTVDVRDEATRALGILIEHDPKALKKVPLKGYVALLRSLDWLDRNKAASIIDSFTKTRDPEVLRQLRSSAVTPLREVVQWKDFSHAYCAFAALGRIAGWDEKRIVELAVKEDVESVLNATR